MTHPSYSGTATTISATLISFIAQSLPLVQWMAAAIAIVVGIRTLYKSFR